MRDEKPQSLQGMIREIYGSLDTEDCAMIDREWARMRGYILPTSGSSRLICAASPPQEEIALKDAHDHLKAGIADMKNMCIEPPMSIYKAMHALTHALTEANDRIHYAEGTAALAMKHRGEAEARLAEAKIALEAPTKEEITLRSQLAEARKALSDGAFQARQWIRNSKGPRDRAIAIAFESFCKEQHSALSGDEGKS